MRRGKADISAILRNTRLPTVFVSDVEGFGGTCNGDCFAGDLIVEHGKVHSFLTPGAPEPAFEEIDLDGRILLPKLVEPHCHLDKCHTIDRLEGVGGDLEAAVKIQSELQQRRDANDYRAGMTRGIEELIESGCGAARTHVSLDVRTGLSLAWTIMRELRAEYAAGIDIQIAALTSLEQFDDSGAVLGSVSAIARDGGVLGCFVFGHDKCKERLRTIFELADRFGLLLDFHVDEGLEDGLDGLSQIADLALEMRFEGPILCGHVCSLMNRTADELDRVSEKLARADISIVALPSTNLYLQGRTVGTPDRRGITRVRELVKASVNVALGCDNVRDAFCPLGRHDPLYSLSLGALTAHLDPPYGDWLPLVTSNAGKAIGRLPVFVDEAVVTDLLISESRRTADLVAAPSCRPLAQVL